MLEARLLFRGCQFGGLYFEIYGAYKEDHHGWIELVGLHKRFVKFAQTIPAEARKAALESGLRLVQAIDCEESRQIQRATLVHAVGHRRPLGQSLATAAE